MPYKYLFYLVWLPSGIYQNLGGTIGYPLDEEMGER
jgi:hypothetical protein